MKKLINLFRDRRFQIILAAVTAWFAIAFILALYVFPGGPVSCGDVAAITIGLPTGTAEFDAAVDECKHQQAIGAYIGAIHFLPSLTSGGLLNWIVEKVNPNFVGGFAFLVGAILVLILEILLIAALINKLVVVLGKRTT